MPHETDRNMSAGQNEIESGDYAQKVGLDSVDRPVKRSKEEVLEIWRSWRRRAQRSVRFWSGRRVIRRICWRRLRTIRRWRILWRAIWKADGERSRAV